MDLREFWQTAPWYRRANLAVRWTAILAGLVAFVVTDAQVGILLLMVGYGLELGDEILWTPKTRRLRRVTIAIHAAVFALLLTLLFTL